MLPNLLDFIEFAQFCGRIVSYEDRSVIARGGAEC